MHQLNEKLQKLDEACPDVVPFDPLTEPNPPACIPSMVAQSTPSVSYTAALEQLRAEIALVRLDDN